MGMLLFSSHNNVVCHVCMVVNNLRIATTKVMAIEGVRVVVISSPCSARISARVQHVLFSCSARTWRTATATLACLAASRPAQRLAAPWARGRRAARGRYPGRSAGGPGRRRCLCLCPGRRLGGGVSRRTAGPRLPPVCRKGGGGAVVNE